MSPPPSPTRPLARFFRVEPPGPGAIIPPLHSETAGNDPLTTRDQTPLPIETAPDLVVLPKDGSDDDRTVEMRRLRKHRVLNLIRESALTSRAEIARTTGYNLPNVSSIVEELVREGLVAESAAVQTPRGRRPVPISLNRNAAMVAGIDIARRSSVAMMMNLRGEVLFRHEEKTPDISSTSRQVEWAEKFVARFFERGAEHLLPLAGIGVAIPGLVRTSERTDIEHRATADPIRRALSEQYGVPVLVDNDSRMMALGAIWFGEGRDCSSFVLLNVSEGLGSGIVLNRRVWQGALGTAGEIGHLPIGERDVPCYCGGTGCLENTASGAGLKRLARAEGLNVEDIAALAAMAQSGNEAARRVWSAFAAALGRAIALVSNLLNPEAVILSGPVTLHSGLFLREMTHAVERRTLPALLDPPRIVVSSLRENTGSLGAGAAVLHHIFHVSQFQVQEIL